MKPLASWTRDLVLRVEQFEKWATSAHPPMIFWLSAFTFPTGFLTAILQTSARLNTVCPLLLYYYNFNRFTALFPDYPITRRNIHPLTPILIINHFISFLSSIRGGVC